MRRFLTERKVLLGAWSGALVSARRNRGWRRRCIGGFGSAIVHHLRMYVDVDLDLDLGSGVVLVIAGVCKTRGWQAGDLKLSIIINTIGSNDRGVFCWW